MCYSESSVFCSLLKYNYAVQSTNCCSKALGENFNVMLIFFYYTLVTFCGCDKLMMCSGKEKMTCSWSPKQSATKYSTTERQSTPVSTSAPSVRLNLTTKLILQQYCYTSAFPYLTPLQSCVRQSLWFCETN